MRNLIDRWNVNNLLNVTSYRHLDDWIYIWPSIWPSFAAASWGRDEASEFQYRTTFTRFSFLFCIVPLNATSRSSIFLFFSSLCVYLPKYRSCFCITLPHLHTCLFPHLSVLIRDIISGCGGRREGKISRWTLSNPFLPFLSLLQ
jgi:hypothetical protein